MLRPREFIEVSCSEVMPHPLNAREHPEEQLESLQESLDEFGDVRSVLAYRSPKRWPGKIVLIDGHARSSLDPARRIKVELLTDLSDEEAEALLAVIDPITQLARYNEQTLNKLRDERAAKSQTVQSVWKKIDTQAALTQAALLQQVESAQKVKAKQKRQAQADSPEQYMVLIHCQDEHEQVQLLKRFKAEGLSVEAKTS